MTASDGAQLNICVNHKNADGKTVGYCTIDCYTDAHCDNGYYCHLENNNLDSGICFLGNDRACKSDSMCGNGMVCNNGKCTTACNTDSDCKSNHPNLFRCSNGACTFIDR